MLAIVLAVHVLQSAGSDSGSKVKPASANQPAGAGSTSGQTSSPSPKPPTATPRLPVTLPATVGGSWAGTVSQGSGNITTNVSLTPSTPNGKITYSGSSFTCSGTLKLVGVWPVLGAAGDRRGAVPGRAGHADPDGAVLSSVPRRVEHGHGVLNRV